MTKKKLPELPVGIVNPFSPEFLASWDLWKEFRWEQHKFKYKGVLSEQAALMRLNDVSKSNEQDAIQIINQSIANCWKDFYELKNKVNGSSINRRNYSESPVVTAKSEGGFGKL